MNDGQGKIRLVAQFPVFVQQSVLNSVTAATMDAEAYIHGKTICLECSLIFVINCL